VSTIRRKFDPRALHFEPLDPGADITVLREVPGVSAVTRREGVVEMTLIAGTDPAAAISRITATVATARIEVARLRLEDVFIGLVSSGEATADERLRVDLTQPEARGVTV
jgi:ABC-type uncharacterized transport system ATPase subunit